MGDVFSTPSGGSYTTTLTMNLPHRTPTPRSTVTVHHTAPTSTSTGQSDKSGNTVLAVLLAIAIPIIAVVVVAVCMKDRQKKKIDAETSEEGLGERRNATQQPVEARQGAQTASAQQAPSMVVAGSSPSNPSVPPSAWQPRKSPNEKYQPPPGPPPDWKGPVLPLHLGTSSIEESHQGPPPGPPPNWQGPVVPSRAELRSTEKPHQDPIAGSSSSATQSSLQTSESQVQELPPPYSGKTNLLEEDGIEPPAKARLQ